jgi:hypothetical protein
MKTKIMIATIAGIFLASTTWAASEGWYRIAPKVRTAGSFDLPGANGSSGKLTLYASDNGTDQQWYLKDVGNWQYELIPRSAMGRRLDVTGGSSGDYNGNQVQVWDANGGPWQRWYLWDFGDGFWEIKSALGSQRALDLDACNAANDTRIQLWDKYANDCQKWQFNNVSVASVYQDCNFTGKRVELVPGNYTMGDLAQIGIGNDWVSSLRVNNGYRIVGYWDDNFTGASRSWSGDDGCLVNVGWNDAITSLKVEVNGGGGSGWVTDFYDGFDGSWLNRNNWTVMVGTDAEFNGEQQWYVDEEGVENNFWVSNGELKIKVQREDRQFAGRWKGLTSARIVTKNKVEKVNGAWEARIVFWKSGSASGVWPAWWLLGNRINEPPIAHADENACWPTYGAREIDIYEYTTNAGALNPGAFITNFISGNACQQPSDSRRQDIGFDPYGYNTYRLEFFNGECKIFLNGNFVRSTNDDPWQDQAMYTILNIAMGGNLGGGVNFTSNDWAGITVDYVKHQYWQ